MSAFIVTNDTMTRIRNFIVDCNHMAGVNAQCMAIAMDKANKDAMKLTKMNYYAVNASYGERKRVSLKLGEYKKETDMGQVLKSLDCLHYQCASADTEKKHAKTWKMLEQLICSAALSLARQTDGYQAGEWG